MFRRREFIKILGAGIGISLAKVPVVNCSIPETPTNITPHNATSASVIEKYLSRHMSAGSLAVIGGRPSSGKTTFALSMARNVAVEMGKTVAIFSLELTSSRIGQMMIEQESGIPIFTSPNAMSRIDWKAISKAAGTLSNAPVFIDDTSEISVRQIREKAEILKEKKGLFMLVIDYLQLLKKDCENMRMLKDLAMGLNLRVVALSQLKRTVEFRNPPIPEIEDMPDYETIEPSADLIILLYREAHKTLAVMKKNRNGPLSI